MSDYKTQFTIEPANRGFMIAAGSYRVYTGTRAECEDCMAAMKRHGLMTPQDWSAAAAVTRAKFLLRGAEIQHFGRVQS